jgi:hypothetical protein
MKGPMDDFIYPDLSLLYTGYHYTVKYIMVCTILSKFSIVYLETLPWLLAAVNESEENTLCISSATKLYHTESIPPPLASK